MDFNSDKTRRSWDCQAIIGVGLVVVIIVVDYYLFNFVFMPHLYSKGSFTATLIGIWINIWIFMLVWSYYKVIYTGPGFLSPHINDAFPNAEQIKQTQKLVLKFKYAKNTKLDDIHTTKEDLDDLEADIDIAHIKRIASNPALQLQETGFCFKCNRVKLPRTHHCRVCGKCVIRMDHHCPWTGNCIGLYNQKFFILFLIYASTALFQIAVVQSIYYCYVEGFDEGLSTNNKLLILIGIVMSTALSMSIGFLGGFQLYIGKKNLTTVENHIKDIHKANPFNKGSWRNFEDIFGTDKSTWMWPVAPKLQSEEYLFLKNY